MIDNTLYNWEVWDKDDSKEFPKHDDYDNNQEGKRWCDDIKDHMTWHWFWQTCCASCISVLGAEEEAEEEILMTMLIIIICLWLLFLLMHIFMFDSFQLLFDLFIFWILRMVITGSAKLVVTLKTTAFSVHSCLTQNVISLFLGGITLHDH